LLLPSILPTHLVSLSILTVFSDLNLKSGLFPFKQKTFSHFVWLRFFIQKFFWVSLVIDQFLSNCFDVSEFTFFVFYFKSVFTMFLYFTCSTKIDFVENQLSLSLIGLSPLIKNPPSIMQHTPVRSFTCFWLAHLVSGLNLFTFLSCFIRLVFYLNLTCKYI